MNRPDGTVETLVYLHDKLPFAPELSPAEECLRRLAELDSCLVHTAACHVFLREQRVPLVHSAYHAFATAHKSVQVQMMLEGDCKSRGVTDAGAYILRRLAMGVLDK